MKPQNKWPTQYSTVMGLDSGMFEVPFEGRTFMVIASTGMGWDHVSVSLANRCPNWREMCHMKDLFWGDEETVVQYHPKKSEYVNNHKFCLHMWRPHNDNIAVPPSMLVGL